LSPLLIFWRHAGRVETTLLVFTGLLICYDEDGSGKSHCTLVSLGCFTMRYLVVLHRAVWVTHFAAAVFSSRFFFQDVGVMNSWETQFAIFLVTKVCTFFLWPMCIHVKFRCTLRVLLALDLSNFWYVPMLRFTSLCATVKTS
jgi:hypothetical protein